MSPEERIAALEARLAAAEARIAALEHPPAPIWRAPEMPFMPAAPFWPPPCIPSPGSRWYEVTCGQNPGGVP